MLAAVVFVVLCPVAALGCSCVELPKSSTAFRTAKAVFVGEVVYVAEHAHLPEKWGDDRVPFIRLVTFKVEKSWKGARGAEIEAWVDVSYFNCTSLQFRVGEKYLVYADGYKGSLVLYWCGHSALTSPFDSAYARQRIGELNSARFRTRARPYTF